MRQGISPSSLAEPPSLADRAEWPPAGTRCVQQSSLGATTLSNESSSSTSGRAICTAASRRVCTLRCCVSTVCVWRQRRSLQGPSTCNRRAQALGSAGQHNVCSFKASPQALRTLPAMDASPSPAAVFPQDPAYHEATRAAGSRIQLFMRHLSPPCWCCRVCFHSHRQPHRACQGRRDFNASLPSQPH